MGAVDIVLPKRIAIIREELHQDIKSRPEEFNLYFKNFIHPIYPWYDIVVVCDYGMNLGHCWRLSTYPEVNEFKLLIKIYDEYGKLVASKGTTIELYDRDVDEPYHILCIGDSMTHDTVYVSQMQRKLRNVFTYGTRSFDGHVFLEGRCGWTCDDYFQRHSLKQRERGSFVGISPFLYPVGIAGGEYFGDMEFYEAAMESERSTFCFGGFSFPEIAKKQYYHKNGKLYQQGSSQPVREQVEWEFSFQKYLQKNDMQHLNAVSLLFGANDIGAASYEETEEAVKKFLDNMKRFVAFIKEADKNIAVIINLPICGAEQYAWGVRRGCAQTEKQYNNNMRAVSKALIQEFEEEEGVYLCPMICCMDGEYGFSKTSVNANLYDNTQLQKPADWIHPNVVGYQQMGDVLAGTVEMLRHNRKQTNKQIEDKQYV